MPCGYACFAYLSHVFALNASVGANAEAGAFPQRDSAIIRTAITPAVGFSMRSQRTRLGVGYAPSFSYIKDLSDANAQIQNQSSTNFSQRVFGSLRHRIAPQTSTAVDASFVTGSFDAIGLRQQLATTVNAGAPVTQGNFRSVTGTGTLSHVVSRRFSLGFNAETSLTEAKATDGTPSTSSEQGVNGTLLGNQFRVGAGVTPSYLLTSRLGVNLVGLAGYQYVSHQQLLLLAASAGSSLAFSRVTSGSVSLGFARTSGLPGEDVPRRFKVLNATASASLGRKLSEGRNAVGFATQLSWAPAYDPTTDRIRSRAMLGVSLTWKPARDWSLEGVAQASTATDKPPQDAVILLNGRSQPLPDTRIALSIPVTYTINRWSILVFGVRTNLPSPNLAQRFKLLDPDYAGFVSINLAPLADRR